MLWLGLLLAACRLFEEAGRLTEEELAVGAVQADAVLRHKFAEEVPVHMRVEMGGAAVEKRGGAGAHDLHGRCRRMPERTMPRSCHGYGALGDPFM